MRYDRRRQTRSIVITIRHGYPQCHLLSTSEEREAARRLVELALAEDLGTAGDLDFAGSHSPKGCREPSTSSRGPTGISPVARRQDGLRAA